MKRVQHAFNDVVSGREVHEYVDKYGELYLSNYPYFFWSFRAKIKNKKESQVAEW